MKVVEKEIELLELKLKDARVKLTGLSKAHMVDIARVAAENKIPVKNITAIGPRSITYQQ
jgi:hypothetical protein